MKDTLIAIGEALIDFIPQQTDCDFDEVDGFSPKCGGAPANVCGAFAALGGKSRLITQLGRDPFGKRIERELKSYGIDTSLISFTDEANTALAFVSLSADGKRTFSFYRKPSADMLLSAESIRPEWFISAFALHFCSVSLGDFPMKDAHKAAIDYALDSGAVISFDPNLRPMLWQSDSDLYDAVWEFLPRAHILKLSDEEIRFITGEQDIEAALPKLFTGNVALIVCTLGKDGARAFTRSRWAYSAAENVKALDTTGAGDGFIGAFLYALSRLGVSADTLPAMSEAELTRCLDFANRFCAYSVQHHGAVPSYRKIDF